MVRGREKIGYRRKPKRNWTEAEINYILMNYEHKTYHEISQALGLATTSVVYKIKLLGLKKGAGYWKGENLKYPVNQDFFKIWSEDSAYILGYLVADGHICADTRHRMKIGLNVRDEHIIDFIIDRISPSAKKTYYPKTNSVSVSISGYELIQSLRDIGLDNKKSNVSSILDMLDPKFKNHFIRGVFDGDGCITFQKRVRGKYRSVEGCVQITNMDRDLLLSIAREVGFGVIDKCKGKRCLVFRNAKFENIKRFFDFIYNDATIFLPRKYLRFKEFFSEKGMR
jgi:hypothetical protein